MNQENIKALDIYWWITYDGKTKDFPREVEELLLRKHHAVYRNLPGWNINFK